MTSFCLAQPLPDFLPNGTSAWLKSLIPFNFSDCSIYVLFFPCYCQKWRVRLWQGSMGDKGQCWGVQWVLLGAKWWTGAGTLLTRTRHTMLRNWRFPSTPYSLTGQVSYSQGDMHKKGRQSLPMNAGVLEQWLSSHQRNNHCHVRWRTVLSLWWEMARVRLFGLVTSYQPHTRGG